MRLSSLLVLTLFLLSFAATSQPMASDIAYHTDLEKNTIESFLRGEINSELAVLLVADQKLSETLLNSHELKIDEIVASLKKKQANTKNLSQFLKHLFYKTHRKYLKNYLPYSSLNETLTSGDYDCLSGTSLYALLLHKMNIEFDVIETNYHIYLRVATSNGTDILIESTDPINGFIDDKNEIDERLANYSKNNDGKQNSNDEYAYKIQLNNVIDLTGLAGLQYYNTAVVAYNEKDIVDAVILFKKASLFYKSPRYAEFQKILEEALLVSEDISNSQKRLLLSNLSTQEAQNNFASVVE